MAVWMSVLLNGGGEENLSSACECSSMGLVKQRATAKHDFADLPSASASVVDCAFATSPERAHKCSRPSGGAAKASLDSLREQAFVRAEGICETMSGSEAPKVILREAPSAQPPRRHS